MSMQLAGAWLAKNAPKISRHARESVPMCDWYYTFLPIILLKTTEIPFVVGDPMDIFAF